MKSFIHAILKILSYVFDIPIENHPSIISGEIIVKRVNNKIRVDTKKVNYSFGSLHRVFENALKKINPFEKFPIQNILILGFGAGSIYEILRKQIDLLELLAE